MPPDQAPATLADLAAGCGYYDQAHLARESATSRAAPTFGARDARALIKFLVDAFGFEETVVYGEGDRVDHAELSWPLGGGVMLGSSQVTAPGAFRAYVVCDDPDALFKRAVEHGAVVVTELTDKDYGSRDFTAQDPEGNHWTFGTYRGHPR